MITHQGHLGRLGLEFGGDGRRNILNRIRNRTQAVGGQLQMPAQTPTWWSVLRDKGKQRKRSERWVPRR